MVQAPQKLLTPDEFLALPETKPASEYFDGEIIQKPMPQGKHSILQRELCFFLTAAFKPIRLAQAFPELRCTFGGRSIVPDIAVFTSQRIPRDLNGEVSNTFTVYPDWTIEILSPNQKQSKVIRNILHCVNSGTEMGWLIDPEEPCLFVYEMNRSVRIVERTDELLPVPEFAQTAQPIVQSTLQLTLGELLDWLKA